MTILCKQSPLLYAVFEQWYFVVRIDLLAVPFKPWALEIENDSEREKKAKAERSTNEKDLRQCLSLCMS